MYNKDKRHIAEKEATERAKELNDAFNADLNAKKVVYIHPMADGVKLEVGKFYTSMNYDDKLVEFKAKPREVIYHG